MLRFSFAQRGADVVSEHLQAAARLAPRRLVNTTYDWAQRDVVRHLVVKPYPAARPGQRYKRTHRLQSGWAAEPTADGARIYNKQPYAGYVVGDADGKGQAWMHAGRWWLARDAVTAAKPKLREALVDEMDRLL